MLLVIQTVQVLLLSVTVFVFFMLFGSLVMETETQLAWTGADTVGQAPLLSHVSLSLVKVSLFLASFSGFYSLSPPSATTPTGRSSPWSRASSSGPWEWCGL